MVFMLCLDMGIPFLARISLEEPNEGLPHNISFMIPRARAPKLSLVSVYNLLITFSNTLYIVCLCYEVCFNFRSNFWHVYSCICVFGVPIFHNVWWNICSSDDITCPEPERCELGCGCERCD